MEDKRPRLTSQSLRVLREVLSRPLDELSGADIARSTSIPSGTLYPILLRLESAGWLNSRWEELDPHEAKRPRRRLYKLTALGQQEAYMEFKKIEPVWGNLA